MKYSYFGIPLFAVCFCLSCGEDGAKSTGECEPACQTGQTCVDGSCQPAESEEKTCEPACRTGQTCVDGSCQPAESEEKACEPACRTGQTCVDGSCVDSENEPEEEHSGETPDSGEDIVIPGDDDTGDDISEEEEIAESSEIALMVTPLNGLETTTLAGKANFTVVLEHKPESQVMVPVKSSDENLGTVDPSALAFDAENWETPQTVTVTGGTGNIEQNTAYSVIVGPAQSEDEHVSKDDISVAITQIKVVLPDPKVDAKNFELWIGDKKVSGQKYDALRGGLIAVKAAFEPENASDKNVQWSLEKCDDDKVDLAQIFMDKADTSVKIRSVLDAHHTFCLVATNKKLNMTKKITFKAYPYLDLGLNVTKSSDADHVYPRSHIRYYKDFNIYNNNYNNCDKLTDEECKAFKANKLGDIPTNGLKGDACRKYFSDELAQRMDDEMYKKFIRPFMYYDGNGNYYGTRASVVAAARFLVLQFPYDIPYMMWGVSRNYSSDHPLANTTLSHYSTSLGGKGKSESAVKSRIYGLNLTKKAYQDRSASTVIRKDAVPWGCLPECDKVSAGKRCIPKNKTAESPNGLECGGLVSWALRNGGMRLGDTTAGFFDYCDGSCHDACPSLSATKDRKYQCKAFVNGEVSASAATRNNDWDKVYEKLNKLSKSDIINVYELKDDQIKAGDIVHRSLTKSDGTHAGHIAIVLGLTRNDDGSIKSVYIGEAVGKSGNSLTSYGWKNFKTDAGWGERFCKDENGKDKYAKCVSHLIRMDKVYNYKQNTAGVDLNTYQYREFWH